MAFFKKEHRATPSKTPINVENAFPSIKPNYPGYISSGMAFFEPLVQEPFVDNSSKKSLFEYIIAAKNKNGTEINAPAKMKKQGTSIKSFTKRNRYQVLSKSGLIANSILKGIENTFEILTDAGSVYDALHDVSPDTFNIDTIEEIEADNQNDESEESASILSDSIAATIMAGGMIDAGVALYSYAKGELSEEQFQEQLASTTAKATTTVYYAESIPTILESNNQKNSLFPMAAYTISGYVITCARELLNSAKLNIEESKRLSAIYNESYEMTREFHKELSVFIDQCKNSQRAMLNEFIASFEYNIETGDNYDQAIYSIVRFAQRAGIALQYIKFDDFKEAMKSKTTFELK